MLGCCGGPCPPGRLNVIGVVSFNVELYGQGAFGGATPQSVTQEALDRVTAHAYPQFDALSIEEGFSLDYLTRYIIFVQPPIELSYPAPSLFRRTQHVPGGGCPTSVSAYVLAYLSIPGPQAVLRLVKARISSDAPFCIDEITNGMAGPHAVNDPNPAPPIIPIDRTLARFDPGVYDLLPKMNRLVKITGPDDYFLPSAIGGNAEVTAMARGVVGSCDRLLDG